MALKQTASAERHRIHQDLVRLGERILEFQFRVALDRFERTDRLVRLGVATLAGMVVVFGFFLTRSTTIDSAGMLAISLSIALVILAIFVLVRMNTALHRDRFLSFGPDIRDLFDLVEEKEFSETQYSRFTAEHIPIHIEVNMEVIQALSARQSRAILLIGLGVLMHLTAISYIVGGAIFG